MEKIDTTVEINDEDTKHEDFPQEVIESSETDWKAKALELQGIAKRRATQLAKAKEKLAGMKSETPPAPPQDKIEKPKSDEKLLEKLEKVTLRSEGITHPDDVEFVRNFAKKAGMEVDEAVADEYVKAKLEKLQATRANVAATANVRGGTGGSDAKNTPEYWISKGVPPTAEQVPNRKVRATIARAFMAGAKTSGKKFYND